MENSATSPTVTLNDSNFEKEVTQSNQTVLVDFWAPWCGPCKMIAPLLDEIAQEGAGRFRIAKVNIDDDPALQERFGIRGVPTLLFFSNGELRDQIVGAAARKTIVGKLENLSAPATAPS